MTLWDIEGPYRLGSFDSSNNPPIRVKLLRLQYKESILPAGHRLRATSFAIRDDFYSAVRQARLKLLKFAKAKDSDFKQRFDKLYIDK